MGSTGPRGQHIVDQVQAPASNQSAALAAMSGSFNQQGAQGRYPR
jgi:hypothetical protein